MSVSGAASIQQDDRVASGSFIGSSSSSYGSCIDIRILKWEECDTIGKKCGFLFGKIVNFTIGNGSRLIRKTIQLFYLDKISEYFFRFMRWSVNHIEPIFTPIVRTIRRVVEFVFKTILCDWILSPVYRWTLGPLLEKVFSHSDTDARVEDVKSSVFLQTIFDGLKKLADWTIVPLYKCTVRPIGRVIGDLTYGTISGALRNDPPEDREEEEKTKAKGPLCD